VASILPGIKRHETTATISSKAVRDGSLRSNITEVVVARSFRLDQMPAFIAIGS